MRLLARLLQLPQRSKEAFLLRAAEAQARGYSPEQAASVRHFHGAAARRLLAARDLRDATNLAAAATLYREAATLAARSVLSAQSVDEPVEPLPRDEVWTRLGDLSGLDAGLTEARELALREDSTEVDGKPALEIRARLDRVDRALLLLLRQVEPRTPRRIRWARGLRLATAVALLVAMLVALLAWAFAPENVARDKQVEASGYWPGSALATALVNGEKEYPWGSATERGQDPWFRVDLGEVRRIDKVVVVNRRDRHAKDSAPLALSLSEDGKLFEEVAVFQHEKPGERWVYRGSNKVARYVKVTRVRRGPALALSEIEVYGPKP